MKKKVIRVVAVLGAVILLFGLGIVYFENIVISKMMKNTEYSLKTLQYDSQNYDSSTHFSDSNPLQEGAAKAAETNELILYISDDNKSIKVYDKRTSKLWDSVVSEQELNSANVNEYFRNMMSSLFKFTYIDLSNLDVPKKEISLKELDPDISKSVIKNGIRLDYSFKNLGIQFAIEFTLINDQLICKMPNEYFKENDQAAESNRAKKEAIQKKIASFQELTDRFLKQAASQQLDSTFQDIIQISVNDIYDLLVKIKQNAGTDNFDIRHITSIQDAIATIEAVFPDNPVVGADIKEMQSQIEDILQDIQYLIDNKTAGIVDFSFMPYFGSATKEVHGYAFYPDLNGAISYFDKSHADMGGSFEANVYDVYSPNEKFSEHQSSYAYYPVFGIKQDNSAFMGYVTQGDYDSSICFSPISSTVNRANAYSKFMFRKITSHTNDNDSVVKVYDKKRNQQDWEVRYKFLINEQADYSGMANAYREVLLNTGLLKKSKLMDGQMPLAANFYMGLESSQKSIFRKYIKMTGWADISAYLSAAKENGVPSSLLNISDWTEHAGNKTPDALVAAPELGGKEQLSSLIENITTTNSVLSVENLFTIAKSDQLSYLVNNYATVKAMNTLTVDANGWVLLNPFYAYNINTINIRKYKQLGCNGITYMDLSSSLYYDYNSKGTTTRETTAAVFNKMIEENKNQIPYSVQRNVILPYLANTDWSMDVGYNGSGFFYTDESVPFYQMVMHGYVCYTATPMNQASDAQYEKLKRLEYGTLPFYVLTEDLPPEIQMEYVSSLFSTKLSDWQKYAFDDYKDYSQLTSGFWNKPIIKHEKLRDGVFRTTFEGGSMVYVNYTNADITIEEQTLKANDYIVVN